MTVKELIEQLSALPQDLQVILQKDAEGNGYSPLSAIDGDCFYVPDSTWAGDVYSNGVKLDETYFYDQDALDEAKASGPCVVLFPIN